MKEGKAEIRRKASLYGCSMSTKFPETRTRTSSSQTRKSNQTIIFESSEAFFKEKCSSGLNGSKSEQNIFMSERPMLSQIVHMKDISTTAPVKRMNEKFHSNTVTHTRSWRNGKNDPFLFEPLYGEREVDMAVMNDENTWKMFAYPPESRGYIEASSQMKRNTWLEPFRAANSSSAFSKSTPKYWKLESDGDAVEAQLLRLSQPPKQLKASGDEKHRCELQARLTTTTYEKNRSGSDGEVLNHSERFNGTNPSKSSFQSFNIKKNKLASENRERKKNLDKTKSKMDSKYIKKRLSDIQLAESVMKKREEKMKAMATKPSMHDLPVGKKKAFPRAFRLGIDKIASDDLPYTYQLPHGKVDGDKKNRCNLKSRPFSATMAAKTSEDISFQGSGSKNIKIITKVAGAMKRPHSASLYYLRTSTVSTTTKPSFSSLHSLKEKKRKEKQRRAENREDTIKHIHQLREFKECPIEHVFRFLRPAALSNLPPSSRPLVDSKSNTLTEYLQYLLVQVPEECMMENNHASSIERAIPKLVVDRCQFVEAMSKFVGLSLTNSNKIFSAFDFEMNDFLEIGYFCNVFHQKRIRDRTVVFTSSTTAKSTGNNRGIEGNFRSLAGLSNHKSVKCVSSPTLSFPLPLDRRSTSCGV